MAAANPQAQSGVLQAASALDLEDVLERITAPTLVITTDRSAATGGSGPSVSA